MYRPYERKPFDAEACTRCGICLEQCPVMKLSHPRAVKAMTRLAAGEPVPDMERRCTSCFTCNQLCPEDCRPANLFQDRWHAAYLDKGLPARAEYFLPQSPVNFRTFVIDRLPADQRGAVESWKRTDPAEEIFFSGCNLTMTPYLTFSRLFEGVDVRGGLDYCCGEMYFRMGLYERMEQIAARLTDYFRRLEVRRVTSLCTACLNILENILPQFGADFEGVEFDHFQKRILARLQSGELEVVKPLDMTVTVQESCHAKLIEEDFFSVPRAILEALGARVIEAEHSREKMLCCGIGSGFSHGSAYHPFEILKGAGRTLNGLVAAGADSICVYCTGCLESMSMAKTVRPSFKPVYHLAELVQLALGETLIRRQNTVAAHLLAGAVVNQFPKLASGRRLKLDELPVRP